MGLPTPRESLRQVGDPEDLRLIAPETGRDHTETMAACAGQRVEDLADAGLHGFVSKKDSPQLLSGACPVHQQVYLHPDRKARMLRNHVKAPSHNGRLNQVRGSLIRCPLPSSCCTRVPGKMVLLSEQSCDIMSSGAVMSSGRRHGTENLWNMRRWVLLQTDSLWSTIRSAKAEEFCRNTV